MSTDTAPLRLPRTALALAEYDAAHAALMSAPLADTDAWNAADVRLEAALDALRQAFAAETADRNHPNVAKLIQPDEWLRRLVQKYG